MRASAGQREVADTCDTADQSVPLASPSATAAVVMRGRTRCCTITNSSANQRISSTRSLLIAILCRQLGERIAEMIIDFAEGLLASLEEDDWEEEADGDPIRVLAERLWIGVALMMDVALDLLWLGFGGFFSPFSALVAALFTMSLLIAAPRLSEDTANLWHASIALHQLREEAASITAEREGEPD